MSGLFVLLVSMVLKVCRVLVQRVRPSRTLVVLMCSVRGRDGLWSWVRIVVVWLALLSVKRTWVLSSRNLGLSGVVVSVCLT